MTVNTKRTQTADFDIIADYGVMTGPGTIRFERVFPGPIDRLWSYFTEPAKLGKWLAGGSGSAARVGESMALTWNHSELSPHKEPTPERFQEYQGSVTRWRILRLDPPRLLSWRWDEGTAEESDVTVELTPVGNNVRLVLTHSRLKDAGNVASGWHTHLAILGDVLAGVDVRPFWSTHAKLEAEYADRLGADVRR